MSNTLKQRILIYSSILFLFALVGIEYLFIVNESWSGDYWEHRAVINELVRNGKQATNPILKIDAPHQFFSPYAVILAFFARLLHTSAKTMLDFAALFNLTCFFISVFLLVIMFLKQHANKILVFILLLLAVLFYHGIAAVDYSGYFHAKIIFLVAPYPSTFCFNCAVISAYLFKISIQASAERKILFFCIQLLLYWIILLTHPLTFIVAVFLMWSLFLDFLYTCKAGEEIYKKKLFVTSVIHTLLPFAIASFWSYYPFYRLLKFVSPGNEFHLTSLEIYSRPIYQLYPYILLVLICFLYRKILKNNIPAVSVLFFCIILSLYGFFSGSFGYGRITSLGQIFASIIFISVLLTINSNKQKLFIVLLWMTVCLPFIVLAIRHNQKNIKITHDKKANKRFSQQSLTSKHPTGFHDISFVKPYIMNGKVVMSEPVINIYIPALGGKVVATYYPVYWVSDIKERRQANESFFSTEISSETRLEILKKYKVDYILLTDGSKNLESEIQTVIDKSFKVSANGISLLKTKPAIDEN